MLELIVMLIIETAQNNQDKICAETSTTCGTLSSFIEIIKNKEIMQNNICEEMNATCGILVSGDEFIDCGQCNGKFELCGGAAPKYNGDPGSGEPLTCGGGCSEVGILECPMGETAIMCSVAGERPNKSCRPHNSPNNEGKWCCERY